jgi:ferredoxin-type protein NapF
VEQSVNLSRRGLLRGRAPTRLPPIRPPGALAEPDFTGKCTTCDECVTACPEGIIFRGSGGYPEVDFRRGECTFCMRCVEVCADEALSEATQPLWRLELRVLDSCLAERQVVCQSCADVCEAEAIRFAPQLGSVATPQIDHDICTGCGACIAACPENALQAQTHG